MFKAFTNTNYPTQSTRNVGTLSTFPFVTESLVIHYDFSVTESYTSGSYIVYNLISGSSCRLLNYPTGAYWDAEDIRVRPSFGVQSTSPFNFSEHTYGQCTSYTQTNALNYTIEAWVKPNVTSHEGPIVMNRGSGGGISLTLMKTGTNNGPPAGIGYFAFVLDSNGLGVGPWNSDVKIDNGSWWQLVGTLNVPTATTINGTNATSYMKLYRNGLPVTASGVWSAGSATSPFTGLDGMILWRSPSWNRNYYGSTAIIRVYTKTLSDDEVLQNFNANRQRFNL